MEVRRQDNGGRRTFWRTVLAAEASVGLLRGYAESALTKWDLTARIDDVRVVVSELATNAVRARAGSQRRITLRISLVPDQGVILVELTDLFPGRPELRDAADCDESGRGLFIVQALAESCGYRDEPDGGKTVWATLRTSE
jgi:anti-sigma regulatory factor (Ser/Thr protein kinase)